MQRENGNKNVGQAMPDSKGNSFWKNEIRLIIRQAEPDLCVTTTNAFTLIELLVVVLIIGILAAVALPQYQKVVERSKATQALTMLKSVQQAATGYLLANGEIPTDFDELAVDIPWTGTERWTTLVAASGTRSNAEWSLQLRQNGSGQLDIYMGRLSGKYKGAGFVTGESGKISCVERTDAGISFELSAGEYCEKIMKGTRNTASTATTVRVYTLP